jgi:hypothetical protein
VYVGVNAAGNYDLSVSRYDTAGSGPSQATGRGDRRNFPSVETDIGMLRTRSQHGHATRDDGVKRFARGGGHSLHVLG